MEKIKINTNNIEKCCLDCIINKLLCAKYFNDIKSIKIIINVIKKRYLSKVEEDEILDIQEVIYKNKIKKYKIKYKLFGKINRIEI
jgi:hypothetical protein